MVCNGSVSKANCLEFLLTILIIELEPVIYWINTILHTDWISWILHFVIFVILYRWSGLKWQWAILLILSIEIWETADWALDDPVRWWVRLDTWMDIGTGLAGMGCAALFKRLHTGRKEASSD